MTDALALVNHAVNTGEGPASGLFVPEIHRLRGVFLSSLGFPPEEVERALRTALEIAEEQGALLLKLRAATSLVRLWLDQGKRNEARDLLAPVYGWFTEGFATLDLKEWQHERRHKGDNPCQKHGGLTPTKEGRSIEMSGKFVS